MHGLIEQGIAEDVFVGFRAAQIRRSADSVVTSGASTKADSKVATNSPGKMRNARLARKRQASPVCFEALRHQKAADRKKHEDADETEDRLVAGQPDQRLVVLRALGDQKGMREDDRGGGDQTQRVEIVAPAFFHPPA